MGITIKEMGFISLLIASFGIYGALQSLAVTDSVQDIQKTIVRRDIYGELYGAID